MRDNLLKRIAALATQEKLLKREYATLQAEVKDAQERVDLEPEIKALLESFQQQEQEKLVGLNQQLLTAILKDVVKNDNEERKVVLDIFTERGLPALGIYIDKNNQGMLEDAYGGSGGAVANILSLGLRVIALIQSKKRRFLVLDEPDCWIKPELIPEFVQVINQLSEKLNIQILMISHHDERLLEAIKHRLILSKENGKIISRWSKSHTSSEPEWQDQEEGIRSIYIENFQSHSSTLIPLAPTVTLISGNNDLGKSTIVNALRAVFYGQSNDTNIKHFENEAQVCIDFGKTSLYWHRKLKGKPKESYIYIDNEIDFVSPLHQSDTAREVPEWLAEETGIGLIEEFDIQLGHQKKPVFLLDEPSSKRAKALSIGDESHYVQKMIALSKEDLSQSRVTIREGEKRLEKIYRQLRIFNKYADFLARAEEQIKILFEQKEKNDKETEQKQILGKQIDLLAKSIEKLDKLLLNIPNIPDIKPVNLPVLKKLNDTQHRIKLYSFLPRESLKTAPELIKVNISVVRRVYHIVKQTEIYQNLPDVRLSEIQAFVPVNIALLLKHQEAVKKQQLFGKLPVLTKIVTKPKQHLPIFQKMVEAKITMQHDTQETQDIHEALYKVDATLKTFKTCPLCHSSLDCDMH